LQGASQPHLPLLLLLLLSLMKYPAARSVSSSTTVTKPHEDIKTDAMPEH
jgi:hypothetical protein